MGHGKRTPGKRLNSDLMIRFIVGLVGICKIVDFTSTG
jgi:hypothetical protein